MRWLFIFCVFLIIEGCNSQSENRKYILKGYIKGLEGPVYLLSLDLSTNKTIYLDTAQSKEGSFKFEGEIDNPYLHSISDERGFKVPFFLEPGEIEILGDKDSINTIIVSGSREDSLFRSIPLDDIFEKTTGSRIVFQNPNYHFSAFTAYYLFQHGGLSIDTMEIMLHSFKDNVRKGIYFSYLDSLYNKLKKTFPGNPAPDFSIPDTRNTIVSLSDYRGKYVLLDFWASWCAPCRAENPELVKIYSIADTSRFEILGISLDESKEKWEKAILQDSLPWTNISNLSGFDELSGEYGVESIPQNFLIDPEGIIVNKNLSKKDLRELLRLKKLSKVIAF